MPLERDDRERLARILDFACSEMNDLREKFLGLDEATYLRDADTRRNVERCVENIVNSSLDAAKIVLVGERWPVPDTYRQYFERFEQEGRIDRETCRALGRGVTLRNVLAHEYLDLRWRNLVRFIQEDRVRYETFLESVQKTVLERAGQ